MASEGASTSASKDPQDTRHPALKVLLCGEWGYQGLCILDASVLQSQWEAGGKKRWKEVRKFIRSRSFLLIAYYTPRTE